MVHTKYSLTHFSIILVYLSYLTVYILNRPSDFSILLSFAGLALFSGVIAIQFFFLLIISFDKLYIKFIYLCFIFSAFTFLNLTNFLVYVTEQIDKHITVYLKIRDILFLFLIFLGLLAYFFKKNFLVSIKVINTFLVFFIVLNILYSIFIGTSYNDNRKLKNENFIISADNESIKSEKITDSDKNILFILLDEYSSPVEVSKFNKDTLQTSLFTKFLSSKGFIVLNNRTIKTSTINSINILFNQNSGLTFRNESTENAQSELKNSSVIDFLEKKGYLFKNFSLYNIGHHESFFKGKGLYYENKYESILNFSFLPLILASIKEDSTSNSAYNRMLEIESINYLNKLQSKEKHFVYVHFLIPHGPFYIENEFAYKRRNLKNYIAYWNFCNAKIIRYLESIDNLSSFKIIIASDHGFRSDRNMDPYMTISALYNFNKMEIEKITTVQDIGNLLLDQ
jgi:hypothetical protein